jgi:hypothetical protein
MKISTFFAAVMLVAVLPGMPVQAANVPAWCANMTMDRRDQGAQDPDRLGKANQPTANQFGATAATAERIRIRTSAFS